MPELPEVETIRRQLEKKVIGKKLLGKKIIRIRRRGKILIIDFEDSSAVILHLKMTGQLVFNAKPSKHTRHIFRFDGGESLIFNDTRKFGWWRKVKNTKKIEKELGAEPLEISLKSFINILKKHAEAKIKTLLMDQKLIAGIGNIYSDEILYAAKVHPLRKIMSLGSREIGRIYKNMKKILKNAILHQGSSVRNFLDLFGREGNYVRYHRVYQKEGKKCERCKSGISRIKLAGRSAHFCPTCQK